MDSKAAGDSEHGVREAGSHFAHGCCRLGLVNMDSVARKVGKGFVTPAGKSCAIRYSYANTGQYVKIIHPLPYS